jgi:N-methylhydantoinase A
MDPVNFLGGRFPLDREAAERALRKHVADPLGISVQEAAIGIFTIVNAKMVDLVRKMTVERGHDPRDFVLCAYGGLGPLHAPFYAGDLEVKAVIIPLGEISSAFSAYGVAIADVVHVHERSINLREPFVAGELEAVFAGLANEANAQLERDGVSAADREMRRFIEVRYVGQLNELIVEVATTGDAAQHIRSEFERLYVETFGPGAAWQDAPIEIVGTRLEAVGLRNTCPTEYNAAASSSGRQPSRRDVYWPQAGKFMPTAILDGAAAPGSQLPGPAIIEYATTTITIPPGWTCTTDTVGNLLLKR